MAAHNATAVHGQTLCVTHTCEKSPQEAPVSKAVNRLGDNIMEETHFCSVHMQADMGKSNETIDFGHHVSQL